MAVVGGGASLGVGFPLFDEANMEPRSPDLLALVLAFAYPIPIVELEFPILDELPWFEIPMACMFMFAPIVLLLSETEIPW